MRNPRCLPNPLLSLLLTTTTTAHLWANQIRSRGEYPYSREPQWLYTQQFNKAVLGSHNAYRSEHAASPLAWNSTLADFSQDYLDSVGTGPNECPPFEHSGGPYGENIAIGHKNATAAIEAFGDERDMYDFDSLSADKDTGHFTQLVWKNTTDLGCARKLCLGEHRSTQGWYLVCEYWPRGNVVGHFEGQVNVGSYKKPPEANGDESAAAALKMAPYGMLMGKVVVGGLGVFLMLLV